MFEQLIDKRENIIDRNGIQIPLTKEELERIALSVIANEGKEMLSVYIDKFNEEDRKLLLDFMKDEWNCVSFYAAVWEICMEELGSKRILEEMSAVIRDLKEEF